MNKTINLLKSRTSVRVFDTSFSIPKKEKDLIIECAKQAPTWMNGQNYQIIIFKDTMKEELAKILEVSGNSSNAKIINQCSIFLLFCIDYHIYIEDGYTFDFSNEVEPLLISTTDVSLALENAVIAAESLELGSCVIGGIRRDADKIIDFLKMPDYTYPIAGVALGKPLYPKQNPKPRLENKINVFDANNYSRDINLDLINYYDCILKQYAHKYNYSSSPWLERFKNYYKNKEFPISTKLILKKQKLF
ncbi:nitroreductase family protein [Mammaliicoccus sciuri]|uniref:nitroreductase family protein n=1 Tax=Mammaliicoccus sciuri TaxID=1296 RepID=UPI0034DD4659